MANSVDVENQKTRPLVHGYVRKSYKTLIPSALIELIILFYDLVFHWKLKNDELQKIHDHDELVSPSIQIDGVTFSFSLESSSQNEVYYAVKYEHLPDDIEYIGVYAEYLCIETRRKVVAMGRLDLKQNEAWTTVHNLSEFEQVDGLCIDCFLEIKYIKYKQSINKPNYNILAPFMANGSIYTWNIKGIKLEKFRNLDESTAQIESPSFDNNQWSVTLVRSGNDVCDWLEMCVDVLLLPIGISGMDLNLNVAHKTTDGFEELIVDDRPEGNSVGSTSLMFDDVMDEDVINIDLQIQIRRCYDENENIIDKSKWNEYGIVD